MDLRKISIGFVIAGVLHYLDVVDLLFSFSAGAGQIFQSFVDSVNHQYPDTAHIIIPGFGLLVIVCILFISKE